MKINNRLAMAPSGTKKASRKQAAHLTLSGEFKQWFDVGVSQQLSAGSWHEYCINSSYNLKRAEAELGAFVRQTRSYDDRSQDENGHLNKIQFYLGSDCVAVMSHHHLQVYARTALQARNLAEGLWQVYHNREKPTPPMFCLIKRSGDGIDTEEIPLEEGRAMDESLLALHYGDSFTEWHEKLLEELNSRPTGITILEGPPGTGKTSYIRNLMACLKDSHRFYFIPSSNLSVLKNSEFVDFWSDQRRWNPERKLAVVLEDAEEALLPRRSDNREEVSVLLNITDGLLGDFLRLHVICTINCSLNMLDPALLRPGRLVARHHFGRLTRDQAGRLAAALGKTLPEENQDEYSLAEIFTGQRDLDSTPKRELGFKP